jgi:hypothetical protein
LSHARRSFVATVDSGGALHGVLPMPVGNQSWYEYLTALPEDEGLLATSVLMRSITLSRMVYTQKTLLALSNVSYVLACESQFDDATYKDCLGLWRQLLQAGFALSAAESDLLGTAAAESCPDTPNNSRARGHSSASLTNVTEGADRVARLRLLDRMYFDGSLQRYEDTLSCAPSMRYTSPDPRATLTANPQGRRHS